MTTQKVSLDGTWQFWKDASETLKHGTLIAKQALKVSVPGPWQAHEDLHLYMGVGWYQRSFNLPKLKVGNDAVILHFGAVDYEAEVFMNGRKVGAHAGGYLSFEIDVSKSVNAGSNLVTIRVADRYADFAEVPHGKQSWYGPISGLWQSVWLECRPSQHIRSLTLSPEAATGEIHAIAVLSKKLAKGQSIAWEVRDGEGGVCRTIVTTTSTAVLVVPVPKLWDLDSPSLYSVSATLQNGDSLTDTCGFRTFESRDGKLWLNGHPVYLRSALDQDYYPELIYTPPSLEYIEAQFRKAKALGLNNLRVHIKVADPRYYIAADRVGLLIWTEIPNWQLLSERTKERSRETLDGMVARDWNRVSIVIRSIINESWGLDSFNPEHRQWLVREYDYLKALDPSRLVVDNSACHSNFHVKSDIDDMHVYYSIPDHHDKWDEWVESMANRPAWTYAPALEGAAARHNFVRDQWHQNHIEPAAEVQRRGDEPLLVSEFGNWGLPNVEKLLKGYGGSEPWWFETGGEWGGGEVYPHGIQNRFEMFHLDRVFGSLDKLTEASQRMQMVAMKYELERMRERSSIQGYVITEFTDVHWECNGLLDMHRNPKAYFDEFKYVNADDVIVPKTSAVAFWPGQPVDVALALSHYSKTSLRGATLRWQLGGFKAIRGEFLIPAPDEFDVTSLGGVAFPSPQVKRATSARLELQLIDEHGRHVAQNYLDLFFFPVPIEPNATKVFAPELGKMLADLGYAVVSDSMTADVVVATTMTEALREHALGGGRVLFLAERDDCQQTSLNGVNIASRVKSGLAGDWASNMNWFKQGPMFNDIPTQGLMNFAFADLTPEQVITGPRAQEFAETVHAGLFLGWIHRNHALIHERGLGRGHIMISTLRLSEHLGTHPVARAMFHDLLTRTAAMRATT